MRRRNVLATMGEALASRYTRPAVCTGRRADRRPRCVYSASLGSVPTMLGASGPPSARRTDGVRRGDGQGERIPRPPWPSKPKRCELGDGRWPCLAAFPRCPTTPSICLARKPQALEAARFSAALASGCRREAPRSKIKPRLRSAGPPPRQSRRAGGQSVKLHHGNRAAPDNCSSQAFVSEGRPHNRRGSGADPSKCQFFHGGSKDINSLMCAVATRSDASAIPASAFRTCFETGSLGPQKEYHELPNAEQHRAYSRFGVPIPPHGKGHIKSCSEHMRSDLGVDRHRPVQQL